MADEKVYLDDSFVIIKYKSTVALMQGVRPNVSQRRHGAEVVNARVIVTDKRIIVDEKMTVLANVAAVTIGDDEAEVKEYNASRTTSWKPLAMGLGAFALLILGLGFSGDEDGGVVCSGLLALGLGVAAMKLWFAQPSPELVPFYAVVIESAGTRDNALVSSDRMPVQRIVRAISDALVGAEPDAGATSSSGRAALP
jgi:hypothetical protein